MSIKRGDVICHSKASEWGVGKVVEVTPDKVAVHFNDGITRKILNSHVDCLLPASPSLYLPVPDIVQKVETKRAPRPKNKVKA